MDLVERLRSALDEREAIAEAAMSWQVTIVGSLKIGVRSRLVTFAAANDPAYALRTIQAHRSILDEHTPALDTVEWPHDQNGKGEAMVCPRCQNADHDVLPTFPIGSASVLPEGFTAPYVLAPCNTLAALASIYFPEGSPDADVDL